MTVIAAAGLGPAAAGGAPGLGTSVVAEPARAQNLSYHGGPVMLQDVNYLIFWEPATLQDGTKTHVSPTYNRLIKRYFRDVGGSGLFENNTQYFQVRDGHRQHIEDRSSMGGVWLDTSPYPPGKCFDPYTRRNCMTDQQIRGEIVKAMRANGWTGGHTHLFFVFTSYGEGSCVGGRITPGCAFAPYCAWHNYFLSSGRMVMYSVQPYSGTRLSYCGVPASPNGDRAADSTISLTSHEQMEAVTDLRYGAWWRGPEAQSGEIADICFQWAPLDEDGGKANQLWNGHYYIVQEEWSNRARACVQEGP